MNRPITSTEVKTDLKTPKKTKVQDLMTSQQFLSNIQRRANTYPSETIPKTCKGTFPNSCYEAAIILIPKSDRDSTKKKTTGQYH